MSMGLRNPNSAWPEVLQHPLLPRVAPGMWELQAIAQLSSLGFGGLREEELDI